jgi:hypothetical protein
MDTLGKDPRFTYSSFCGGGGCVGAAWTPDGLVALQDSKTGAQLQDDEEAFRALVSDVAAGPLGYDNLTAEPRKSSFSGNGGCFYVSIRPDGWVVVTSDYLANDPAHPGLTFDRGEWEVFEKGCKAGHFALDLLKVLPA